MSDDDFGLSSSDEADLLHLDGKIDSAAPKRNHDDDADSSSKRRRHGDVASPAISIANQILRQRFNIDSFRLQQEAAIAKLLDGESAVVVFPTGGGKSLCYQVPALCFQEMDRLAGIRQGPAGHGITLVVSPLIALMKDQVDALQRKNIKAAVMDSTKSTEEYLAIVDDMRKGALDIIYCAPERLNNEGFVASMANVKGGVRLLAVDEAHCISEWGHAFRPDYLKVARFCKEIGAERVVCLTATATPQVADDICNQFEVPKSGLFRTSTYRPNLKLSAESFQTKKDSYPRLMSFLKAHPGPTIIYVTTREQSEVLALKLTREGFKAEHFHAGMKVPDKIRVQDAFMASDSLIICATIAFGMGIDKNNIRNVIHYDIPRSLEGYSQEIGRAGRDGLDSRCVMYLCAEDLHLRESFARGDLPSKKSVRDLLGAIFSSEPSKDPIPVIEANMYHLSREYDIRPTVLGNIFAQLELRFDLLRATTPKYSKYQYKQLASTEWDTSSAAVAIHASAKPAKTWTHLDIDLASHRSGLPRPTLVAKLNDWHDTRKIELQTAGVVNIFRIVSPSWPPPPAGQTHIIDQLYHELQLREQRDLDRGQQVLDLITGDACFARTLAHHFGDALPDGATACGHCTWCERGTPVPKVTPPSVPFDAAAFRLLLQVVPERDDARFLARVAFGISSPRVAMAKLSGSRVFGSMEDHDFMTLLRAFEKECEK